jgi:hypothetical protein
MSVRQVFAGITLGVALALMAPAAGAQTTGVPLRLEGITVLQLRTSAGGYTPYQRYEQLRRRFAELLRRPDLEPEDVEVEVGPDERTATVWVGQLLFVTATEADAWSNGTQDPEHLAQEWASNLRRAYERARSRREAKR